LETSAFTTRLGGLASFILTAFIVFGCPDSTHPPPSFNKDADVVQRDAEVLIDAGGVVDNDTGVVVPPDAQTFPDAETNPDSGTTATVSWANENSPLGINLESVQEWVGHWPFVDAFKTARNWIPQQISPEVWDCTGEPCNCGSNIDLTPEGWVASLAPNQAVGTLLFREHDGHFPRGEYVVLYDGEGDLSFHWEAKVTSSQPGRMTLNVSPGPAGIYAQITATNPQNPIRNIRVIMPGFESTYETQPFHPLFLETLSKFKIIRFQHWHMVNEQFGDDAVSEWSDLPDPNSFQSTWRGVHPIWMIKLANTLHADPWFQMPHKVNDDFVRQFATLVKNELDPELTSYIEYSNEIWNGVFPQSQYINEKGLENGLGTEDWMAGWRYYSIRSVEIFNIWKDVLGTEKLVRVIAGQSASPFQGFAVMEWNNAYMSADAYASAPYIMGVGGSTVSEVLDNLEADIAQVMQNERENADNARMFGLKHITYEGGQHLVGSDEQQRQLFLEANRHPRMKTIYLDYLNQWFAIGDGPFVYYSYIYIPNSWGSWGALEYQDQRREDAPKYDALMTFIENYP
jgi:hypothetical protein